MAHVQRVCRPQGLTTWVDDIGVDFRGFTPDQVAAQAVSTFLELREGLVSRGLEISTKKSGFLVGDVETGKALKAALAPYADCPGLKDTIKDLGIDNSLARKRRLAVHHSRLWKGRARLKRVKQLPARARRKFVNMAANSVALWGHMARGVPPQKLRAWRLGVARTNKWLKGRGSLEVAMQIHSDSHDDPFFRLRLEQLKIWVEIVRRCGAIACTALAKAWEASWIELKGVKHRWMIVKGPMAATQAVLMDVGWIAACLDSWVDDCGNVWSLDYCNHGMFAQLELGFVRSLRRRQNLVMSAQFFGEGIASGLDVAFHRRLFAHVSAEDAPLLQVSWQGALQHSLNSNQKICQRCSVELTLVHMLFERAACIEHCGAFPPECIVWYSRPELSHFWLRGLVPSSWTSAPPVASENIVRSGVFVNPVSHDFSDLVFATDGSGGPFSQDPCLRKCAWAVVALVWDGRDYVLAGSVTGYLCDDGHPNTVARAELRAFLELLEFLPEGCEPPVAVDASFVVNVYTKLKRCRNRILNPHGDLKVRLVDQIEKKVRLTKVKSHLTLEEHLGRAGESWSWHANKFADEFANMAALSIAPYGKEEANAWVWKRTQNLTQWVLPRIRFWLAGETKSKDPAVGPRRTKDEFFRQATAKSFGGHDWVPCAKGMRCNACSTVLKRYRLLTDLEVLAALPCSGNRNIDGCEHPLISKVHFTHTMVVSGSNLCCTACNGRLSGHCKGLTRKLLFPCGSTGLYRRH